MASLSMLRAFANGEISSLTEEAYQTYYDMNDMVRDLTLGELSASMYNKIIESSYMAQLEFSNGMDKMYAILTECSSDQSLTEGAISSIVSGMANAIKTFFSTIARWIEAIINKIKEWFSGSGSSGSSSKSSSSKSSSSSSSSSSTSNKPSNIDKARDFKYPGYAFDNFRLYQIKIDAYSDNDWIHGDVLMRYLPSAPFPVSLDLANNLEYMNTGFIHYQMGDIYKNGTKRYHADIDSAQPLELFIKRLDESTDWLNKTVKNNEIFANIVNHHSNGEKVVERGDDTETIKQKLEMFYKGERITMVYVPSAHFSVSYPNSDYFSTKFISEKKAAIVKTTKDCAARMKMLPGNFKSLESSLLDTLEKYKRASLNHMHETERELRDIEKPEVDWSIKKYNELYASFQRYFNAVFSALRACSTGIVNFYNVQLKVLKDAMTQLNDLESEFTRHLGGEKFYNELG